MAVEEAKEKERPGSPPVCDTAAVIVAAGRFTRMEGIPKQLAIIDGKPVIAHTLSAFEKALSVREIVLVVRPEDREAIASICKQYHFTKVSAITDGGATRQESAAAGIACTSPGIAYFAIHDGARPLVASSLIDGVIQAARRYHAASAAVRVKDTVKIADASGFIQSTPDRRFLWNVQTPQVFESGLYQQALQRANEKGMDFTDDCQLVEQLGHRVYLYEADYKNIKITTPEDLSVAEKLLQERRAEK